MEFPFNVARFLPDKITLINGGKKFTEYGNEAELQLQSVIDNMGKASAKAQSLKAPITTYSKLVQSKDQIIYFLRESNFVVGFIKTGRRRLFLWDQTGLVHEVTPLCILDFYVHESRQRKGYGKVLFQQVLESEEVQPFEVAIDRPSIKFLKFLQKHYNLYSFVKQNNNYVVFKDFFTTCIHYDHAHSSSRRHSLPSRTRGAPVRQCDNRLSLSPKWSVSIPEEKPHPADSNATPTAPSKTSFTGSENMDHGIPLSYKDFRQCADNGRTVTSPEQLSWSELVNPVPGSKHAPFLTLRGGSHRQRNVQSVFEGGGTSGRSFMGAHAPPSFHNKDSHRENTYSKYGHEFASTDNNMRGRGWQGQHQAPPSYGSGTRQPLKKQPWKDYFH